MLNDQSNPERQNKINRDPDDGNAQKCLLSIVEIFMEFSQIHYENESPFLDCAVWLQDITTENGRY